MKPSPSPISSAFESSGVTRRAWLATGGVLVAAGVRAWAAGTSRPGSLPSPVLLREFIYEDAPFPKCHASTVVELRRGLAASWFGGSDEGHDDVSIYVARRSRDGWSAPEKVAEGLMPGDARRYPCWNPVLFRARRGPLWLFYKVGPRPSSWWGMVRFSRDDGRTWSEATRLPEGQMGPVRAKPVELPRGTLLCGSSTEYPGAGWQVQMESTQDPLGAWTRTPPLNRGEEWGAIQPTLLVHDHGRVQILCRSRQGVVLQSWSEDYGRTWGPLTATDLPNPNSGIDAVRLRDGRYLLLYNHAKRGRDQLNLALSRDGKSWEAALELENEPGEFSYPAMIVAHDGLVHLTYTWKRTRVRHVVVDPRRLTSRPFRDGEWPADAARG